MLFRSVDAGSLSIAFRMEDGTTLDVGDGTPSLAVLASAAGEQARPLTTGTAEVAGIGPVVWAAVTLDPDHHDRGFGGIRTLLIARADHATEDALRALAIAMAAAALVLLLVGVPLVLALAIAFTSLDGIGAPAFTGFTGLRALVADHVVRASIEASLVLLALAVPLRLAGALLLAVLLRAPRRGQIGRAHV